MKILGATKRENTGVHESWTGGPPDQSAPGGSYEESMDVAN